MHKKNLIPQKTNSTKHTGEQPSERVELAEMAEVSDEDLKQLFGGREALADNACVGSCVACSC